MSDIPPDRPTSPSVRDPDLERIQLTVKDVRTRITDGMIEEIPERPSFQSIYMALAVSMSGRSTCRRLHVGCAIVTPDFRKVLSVGYNGNVSNGLNDCDRVGEAAIGNCGCIHAEQNAVINCDAPRSVEKIVFCTHLPCVMCAKFLIQLGNVQEVYYLNDYRIRDALWLFERHHIRHRHFQS
jgi:dCMP deaminase